MSVSWLVLILDYFHRALGFLRLTSKPRLFINDAPAKLISLDPETGEKTTTTLGEVLGRCESLVGPKAWYTPTFWLSSGHLATIYCTVADFSYEHCTYSRRLIRVPDGGCVGLDFTPPITPSDPLDSRPILMVMHGLTGGSHESYVIDILTKITKEGWRGCVVNFRGCAGTPVLTKQLYSGAYTDDLRCAVSFLSHAAPKAPLYGIGFSLGANVLGKYLGEEGEKTALKAGVIVGCPWDFYEGHIFLTSNWLSLIYSKAMASNLRRMFNRHRERFVDDPRLDFDAINANPQQTLYEFDSVVTRVLGGYSSTEAYYRNASAKRYAADIAVPTLSINCEDDPIVHVDTVPTSLSKTNPFLAFVTTRSGGHLGWFSGFFQPRRWIGRPVIEFLREIHGADPTPRLHKETVPSQDDAKHPEMGDELVLVQGQSNVGFAELDEGTFEGGQGSQEDDGLIKGL